MIFSGFLECWLSVGVFESSDMRCVFTGLSFNLLYYCVCFMKFSRCSYYHCLLFDDLASPFFSSTAELTSIVAQRYQVFSKINLSCHRTSLFDVMSFYATARHALIV